MTARYCDLGDPVAFEELLSPFIEAARREVGDALDRFSDQAQAVLERSLLVLLSQFATPVLASEFALHRALEGLPLSPDPRSSVAYRRFVGGGLAEILRAYPVLHATLTSWCDGWARSQVRMARQLREDGEAIRAAFGVDVGAVEAVTPGLSDAHEDGAMVVALRFADGARLVHKPRSLGMEAGFEDLLGWANARGFGCAYRPIAVLDRGDHGWMAWVDAAPCADEGAIGRFYTRIGGLICLVGLLQGSDIHHENVIASGEHPVIVDAETLFHPALSPAMGRALGAGAGRSAGDHVTATLADSGFFARPDTIDFSALSAIDAVATPFRIARSVHINTDAMEQIAVEYAAPARANVPMLDGRAQPAGAHVAAIVAGYRAMAAIAIRHRAALIEQVQRFAGRPGRLVVRASNIYGLLIQRATQTEAMRDAAARRAAFVRSLGAPIGVAGMPDCRAILNAELRALDRMTVPRLSAPCDAVGPGWASPLAEVTARIARFSAEDVERQVAWIEDTLAPAGRATREALS